MRERWGSFSVKDHISANNLASDVLMYDRLIFPVPPNEEERNRWKNNNWKPDLQSKRLEVLGKRAIKIKWDKYRQEKFTNQMDGVLAIAEDSNTIIPGSDAYQMTRIILSQDDNIQAYRGSSKAIVAAAYQSINNLRKSYILKEHEKDDSALSICIRNRLVMPVFTSDEEKNFELALELSADNDFANKRRALYTWQEKIANENINLVDALDELEDLIQQYNENVKKAEKNVINKFFVTVVGATVLAPTITTLLNSPTAPLSDLFSTFGPSGLITLAAFLKFDMKPVIDHKEANAVAMFHDVEQTFLQ
ncbi:MAG: hypothetical protein OQL19_04110 [Gammaproteobacteria bacterium]|nr:hypothetical protein [Gammaproteobacteria bacterium]